MGSPPNKHQRARRYLYGQYQRTSSKQDPVVTVLNIQPESKNGYPRILVELSTELLKNLFLVVLFSRPGSAVKKTGYGNDYGLGRFETFPYPYFPRCSYLTSPRLTLQLTLGK
jgi:hypothetical protein